MEAGTDRRISQGPGLVGVAGLERFPGLDAIILWRAQMKSDFVELRAHEHWMEAAESSGRRIHDHARSRAGSRRPQCVDRLEGQSARRPAVGHSSTGAGGWSLSGCPTAVPAMGPALARARNQAVATWKGKGDDPRLFWAVFDGSEWRPTSGSRPALPHSDQYSVAVDSCRHPAALRITTHHLTSCSNADHALTTGPARKFEAEHTASTAHEPRKESPTPDAVSLDGLGFRGVRPRVSTEEGDALRPTV